MKQFTKPGCENILDVDFQTGPVAKWSFTALKNYEECAHRTKLRYVDKIIVESGEAASRGSKIHDLAEKFTRSEISELPKELSKFQESMEWLRDQFSEGNVEVEEDWGITKDWTPCTWQSKDLWGRIKLDAFVRETEESAMVIDHKTGRKFGNEFKHNEQGMVYAIAAFERYPEINHITTEFWYLDHGEKLTKRYTRSHAEILKQRVHRRAVMMTTATDFPPNPSKQACKWCDYGEGKNKNCEWRYQGE